MTDVTATFDGTLESMRDTLTHAMRRIDIAESEVMMLRETLSEAYQREAMPELELQLSEPGWRQISLHGDREFSRAGLATIQRVCRMVFLKNPLVRRSVTLQSMYVWAQGYTISSPDERTQAALDEILSDRVNKLVIGYGALRQKEE